MSRARIPPTIVEIQPWTCQTALVGPKYPMSSPIAICAAHAGAPLASPETVLRKESAARFPPRYPTTLCTAPV